MSSDSRSVPTADWATRWAPLIVVILGLSLTAGAFAASSASLERVRDTAFETEVQKIDSAIQDRFLAYQQVLRGGLSFWVVEQNVTREEWAAYVDGLELERDYPGIQGVGYSQFIAADELDAHEAAVQAQGFPEYHVHDVDGERPPGPRYTSIIYLEPFDARNQAAHGLDMYSHPERRQAMDRAIDEGVPALSGRVILVQEIDEDVQPGFLLYLAHYTPGSPTGDARERQESVLGFVYAPFRAGDLMTGILGEGGLDVTFEVYDGDLDAAQLLYDEDGTPIEARSDEPMRQTTGTMEVAGREWHLRYATTPAFEDRLPGTQPALIGVGGIVVTGLIALVAYSQGRTQRRAVALATDMTAELRRSEQEKARLAEDLARSNADLEQFAYLASHDLQEPARTVQAYLGLLHDEYNDKLPEDGQELIATARDGARRMRVLIQSLLEYSRAGRHPIPDEPTDANVALQAALQEAQAGIEEAKATVHAGDLPAVWIPEAELTRVFLNLISNALKYRGEEAVHMEVSAERSGSEWIVSFADNGIGIAPAHAEEVFTMFGRLHPDDQYPGSGMGLAIAKKTMESVRGRIWVESDGEKGATFKLAFPVEAQR